MANTTTKKTASFALLLALLSAAPLASTAIGPHRGPPNGDDFDGAGAGDQGGFFGFGMPWFGGGDAPAGGAAGFFGGGGGVGGGGGGGAGFGSFGGSGAAGTTWYRRGAVVPPSTVCEEDGPCRGKRLTCPARCFKSYSYEGKNGGGGGGGGGCSFDCTSRCVASC